MNAPTALSQAATVDGPRDGWKHLPQLDGLRGVAIILVLVSHEVKFSLHLKGFWGLFVSLGHLGVVLFFVLSGLLITGLLLDEEARTGSIDLRKFYARRALRILPALVAYVLVMSCLKLMGLTTDFGWAAVIVCLLYLTNIWNRSATFSHTWTLSLEEQFYVLWPTALKALGRFQGLWTAVLLVLVINAWRIYSILRWPGTTRVYFRPDYRFDSVLMGCILAMLLGYLAVRPWKPRLLRFTNPWVLFPMALAWTVVSHATQPGRGTLQLPLQNLLCFGILAHMVLAEGSSFNAWLSHPWLQYVGRLSYSLYIWQQIFLFVKVPDWGLVRAPIFDLLPTFACALVSYYVIERPFLRHKEAFSS